MAFQAKRRFQRSVQREAVKILSKAGIEYATYEDLSAGGLRLWLDHEVDLGTLYELEFKLRVWGQSPLEILVQGRVVRCVKIQDGFDVGVEFLNLPQATIAAIQKHFSAEEGPF